MGGIFAGLDVDQITGFDQATLQSALETAKANLPGGLGDFASIAGGDTAFDLIADFASLTGDFYDPKPAFEAAGTLTDASSADIY